MDKKKDSNVKSAHGFIDNLGMRGKLFFTAGSVFAIALLVCILVLSTYLNIRESTSKMESSSSVLLEGSDKMADQFSLLRINIYKAIAFGEAEEYATRDTIIADTRKIVQDFETTADAFVVDAKVIFDNPDSEEYKTLVQLDDTTEKYIALYNNLLNLVAQNKDDEAVELIAQEKDLINTMIKDVSLASTASSDILAQGIININRNVVRNIIILIVLILVMFILSYFISAHIANKVSKSMATLLKNVNHLQDGQFDKIVTSDYKDEIGEITRSLVRVSNTVDDVINDVISTKDSYNDGTIKPTIDVTKYNGGYEDLADAINTIFEVNAEKLVYVAQIIEKISSGEFTIERINFPGEQAVLTNSLFMCLDNILALNNKILEISTNANVGIFKAVETEGFENAWLKILTDLNQLIERIEIPIIEVNKVLGDMAEGQLSTAITGEYRGIFKDMKENVNTSVAAVNLAIREARQSLNRISENDLNFKIETEYKGDFNEIKLAINAIIDRLNSVFGEFNASANSVTQISKTLSDSSVNIANGATEQAATIQELNVTIETISGNTRENAEKSENAKNIATASRESAVRGDQEMRTMLKSMEDIKSASDNIANIIKVIDDIAFQTNLLALNAAVEAARAGQHGKGFAIVADEVRTLAGKSKEAASQTAALINESLEKVNLGNTLANSTAAALNEIVDSVTQVSTLLDEISASSNEQADSISEIVSNLTVFEQVVQNNTIESEESAESAKNLSNQALLLKELIDEFELLDR